MTSYLRGQFTDVNTSLPRRPRGCLSRGLKIRSLFYQFQIRTELDTLKKAGLKTYGDTRSLPTRITLNTYVHTQFLSNIYSLLAPRLLITNNYWLFYARNGKIQSIFIKNYKDNSVTCMLFFSAI